MINKQNKAFTMAEVLVTLLIIGVVAAVTIPGLRESTDQSGNIALAKKAYATASNAFAQLQATYGPVLYWTVPQNAPANIRNVRVFGTTSHYHLSWMLQSKMNVTKKSFSDTTNRYTLSGDRFTASTKIDDRMKINLTGSNFQTADGMQWFLSNVNQYCSFEDAEDAQDIIPEQYLKLCALLLVDINGSKKPNRMGVDMFVFDITAQGIVPHQGNDCTSITDKGYSCSDVILSGNEKALDFIYE